MPVTYEECGPEEYEILGRLKRQYRDDLVEADARIAMFFVLDTESNNVPALMVRGKPAQGSAKVNSVGDRAEGKADATIRLDRYYWERMTDRQRVALVHHELSHIGCPNPKKKDSLDRPVLKPVHADWETDGFDEVVQLYKEDAPEKINLNIIRERLRVQGLKFGDEAEAPTFEQEVVQMVKDARAEVVADLTRPPLPTSVSFTSADKPILEEAADLLRDQADEETPTADRWRSIPLITVTERLSPEAFASLHDEYELRTLGDIADFLEQGERLHELPLLGLDNAAVLAEDLDRHRCDHGGGAAAGIQAEWLADTLAAYRDSAIEAAKVKKAPKKGKAKGAPAEARP